MRILNHQRRREVVLEADRDSDQPTVFVMRRLNWEELAWFQQTAPFTPQLAASIEAIAGQAEAEGRELTLEEATELAKLLPEDKEFFVRLTRAHASALKVGVIEIRHLQDEDGNPLELAPAEVIDALPASAINELGRELMRFSRPEGDLKNFAVPRVPGRVAAIAASAPGNRTTRRAAARKNRSSGSTTTKH